MGEAHVEISTITQGCMGARKDHGQKPRLKIKEVWAIRVRLQLAERSRD
jgi:hypothetical protein